MMTVTAEASRREAVLAVGARWSAGQRELVHAIAALDASNEWALEGSVSCAHWVADALDVEVSTARDWLRVGRRLQVLSTVDRKFADGELSYSKVRALTRVATPESEEELCDIARDVPAGRLAHALAQWLLRRETPDQTEARQQAKRHLTFRDDPDGMIAGSFRLPPGEGAVFQAALETELSVRAQSGASADAPADGSRRWPSFAQQRADAFVALVVGGGMQAATEIVLHVRGDGCTLDDGTPIADSLVERLVPQSFLRVLIHDAERRPINASGKHRHPTDRQKRVVHERDGRCQCGSHKNLQYHHDPPFDESKRTLIDELLLRCTPCHHDDHAPPAQSA
jgi:hypothetical protein